MNRTQEQVREFHETFHRPVGKKPDMLSPVEAGRRLALMAEELGEFAQALLRNNFPLAVDALGDLEYVVHGTAVEMGIDLEKIVDVIHASNMTKLGRNGQPIILDGGKVAKGPDYKEPDIVTELIQQGY